MKDARQTAHSRQQAALADALKAAARTLNQHLANIERAAETAEAMADWHAEMAALPDRLDEMLALTDQGHDASDAAAHVAQRHGLRADHLLAHFRQIVSTDGRTRRWRRDREIVRLAHTNSNAAIGARFDLSESHVSRIVQKMLRGQRQRPFSQIPKNAAPLAIEQGDRT